MKRCFLLINSVESIMKLGFNYQVKLNLSNEKGDMMICSRLDDKSVVPTNTKASRFAKTGDEDYKLILDRKDLTHFESRRHLVRMYLPEVTQAYVNGHKMLINRSSAIYRPPSDHHHLS
nr:E3 ubiquitin-protein ligase UPL5-like [Tanacetum cinerariifolium]